VENLVVGLNKNRPVYLRQVASVQDGPSTAKSYVSFGYGKTNDNYKVRNLNIPRLPYPLEKSKERMQ
jgi:hypothetical protein